jgi:predicted nucleotidyltransferase
VGIDMIVVGIICEYNPLHNGHLYQIRKIREQFGEDCAVIAIMSGNFVQRGEAAVLDKWSRARAALLGDAADSISRSAAGDGSTGVVTADTSASINGKSSSTSQHGKVGGVNLVIELPTVYATGSAELFADGGVAIAAATGLCDFLVFGSEAGDINNLTKISDILSFEPDEYKTLLKKHLDTGVSFPSARLSALNEYLPSLNAGEILKKSNNILAIEYLKSIARRQITGMEPFTIKRMGQDYQDSQAPANKDAITAEAPNSDFFWSATAIRNVLAGKDILLKDIILSLSDAMPTAALAILAREFQAGNCILSQEIFADVVYSQLLPKYSKVLDKMPGMNEGLGSRLKNIAANPGKSTNKFNSPNLVTSSQSSETTESADPTDFEEFSNTSIPTKFTEPSISDNAVQSSTNINPLKLTTKSEKSNPNPSTKASDNSPNSASLNSLIEQASTKRFPKSRVRRAIIQMLLGIKNEDLTTFEKSGGPQYLRILGFDKKGQYLLKRMRKSASLPIIMKGSDFLEHANTPENHAFKRMAELDCISTDIWSLKTDEIIGKDFTYQPVMLLKKK